MRFIADFHVHSRYSRATSKDMEVETLGKWAEIKGITVLGTGDFTHPSYFAELKTKLEPSDGNLLTLKNGSKNVSFVLTAEVSNIFSQAGKLHKIHTLVFAPTLEVVEKINAKLGRRGKLSSDGRPTFGFHVKDLVKLVLDTSEECFLVPAHAWTPWFSLFGANSGFDSMEECFGDQAEYIYAIETGLSSDPEMNWRLSALDRITLISNSDAHSPAKIGREANVFNCDLNYNQIIKCLREKDHSKLLFTVEFFPEGGKYHYDGHRNCGILFSPSESKNNDNICPVCKRGLTIGVMHRVETLSDRPEGFVPEGAIPARHLVPLEEIIAEVLGCGVNTVKVRREYEKMIAKGGNEFNILLYLSRDELTGLTQPNILEGIMKVREGKLKVIPGYDGVYGKISMQ
ncbi:MAG: PHP domain-containing protein [bacterium]|nr:MAG: PHP domain-containing protein [bacterium]